jgi:small subunit ribosomal protein S16
MKSVLKKRPCYKIVVMNSLWRRDGKAIAEIGQYDPFQKRLRVEKKEFVKFIKNGAYPTNTVRHLMTKIL